MCDIVHLTNDDIRRLKKTNNSEFYDCCWSMKPISTEYLKQINPDIQRLLNIKRDILTFEDRKNHDKIHLFFDDLIGRLIM
jgi:hypothetical protein